MAGNTPLLTNRNSDLQKFSFHFCITAIVTNTILLDVDTKHTVLEVNSVTFCFLFIELVSKPKFSHPSGIQTFPPTPRAWVQNNPLWGQRDHKQTLSPFSASVIAPVQRASPPRMAPTRRWLLPIKFPYCSFIPASHYSCHKTLYGTKIIHLP